MKKFSWQTPEYIHTQKTSDWYWTVGIIASALVLTSVIFGNYLFGLVLAIGTFTLTLFTLRKPNVITIEINDKGVRVDSTLYPFHTLDSFGVSDDQHHGIRLFLRSKKVVMPLITLPLVEKDAEEIRVFLADYLKEDTFEQGLMHTILERLGF